MGSTLGRFVDLPDGQASCNPPSPLVGNELRGTFANGELWGLLFAAEVKVGAEIKIVWRMTGEGSLDVSATGPTDLVLRPIWGPEPHGWSTWTRPGDEWGTGFVFTAPGCWHIRLTRTQAVADAWLNISA